MDLARLATLMVAAAAFSPLAGTPQSTPAASKNKPVAPHTKQATTRSKAGKSTGGKSAGSAGAGRKGGRYTPMPRVGTMPLGPTTPITKPPKKKSAKGARSKAGKSKPGTSLPEASKKPDAPRPARRP